MNVQPLQQQPITTTQRPILPEPQSPGFTQTDPNDMEFLFDEETGNLSIVAKKKQDSSESEVEQLGGDLESDGATNKEPISPATGSESFKLQEDRLTRLEGGLYQLAQYLNQMKTPVPESQPQELTSQVNFESEDWPNQIVGLINTSITKTLDQRLGGLQQDFDKMKVKSEFTEIASKYGQPFLDLMPMMSEIKKSDPNVGWESLYLAMSKARDLGTSKTDSTNLAGNGILSKNQPNGQKLQPANKLVERAQALSTERTGSPRNLINEKRNATSIEEAFNSAFDELYG